MLAAIDRRQGLIAMKLGPGGDIDNVNIGAFSQIVYALISRAAELAAEPVARMSARLHGRRELER